MNIKKILVPVDFSPSSDNAAAYACLLAKNIGATLTLFHAYQIPALSTDMPVMAIAPQALEDSNRANLEVFRDTLLTREGKGLTIICKVSPGFAVDEIGDFSKEEGVDLLVMGISGSGKIAHALMGSVTTGVMKHVPKPLLIVPEEARFTPPSKIAFANDYEGTLKPETVNLLSGIVNHFKSSLLVIHVGNPNEKTNDNLSLGGYKLQEQLKNIPLALYFPTYSDVIDGLMEFERDQDINLLVMVPRHHNLLSRIFHGSTARKMAYHTHIPILAIHE